MISIWERETFYADADVLIAGGGLAGLWTAYELLLARPGVRVTICEQQLLPALASTRNAGFACFGSPGELWADLQQMGEAAMWQVVENRYRGIARTRAVLGDAAIEFDCSGGYELYPEDEDWNGSALEDKLALLNKGFEAFTGIKDLYTHQSGKMAGMDLKGFAAMAGNSIEGGLHSGKVVEGLKKLVTQMGARYLAGHKVLQPAGEAQGRVSLLTAATGNIISLRTATIIWATNAGLGGLPALAGRVVPARGQVLLSPPVAGLSLRGTFHYDEGYYYFRNLQNRLLIGGARNIAFTDEETLEPATTPQIGNALLNFVRQHLPQVAPALPHKEEWLHWAGIMGMTPNKQPILEKIAANEWALLACNGMGVALTPIAAQQLARQVLSSL
ncbi:MAG: FAD-binding oxidoreductase [Chitinophagaceae bacterium]|nr:FAD-binding oxidoreductase [Chitinophagaceae bacterium]